MADLGGFEARKADSEARGRRRGLGYGNLLEACGAGIADRAVVSCLPDGQVHMRLGSMSNGQSHETVYAQMLSDCLDIDINKSLDPRRFERDALGDGNRLRSMTVCGSALVLAADEVIEEGRKLASQMLEAAETDIHYENASYSVVGTDRSVSLGEVAAQAIADGAPAERGLEVEHRYDPTAATYPNGCHIAELRSTRRPAL